MNSVLDICEAVTRLVNLKLIIIDIHNDKISSKMLERKGFTFKMKNQLGGTLIYEKLLW